MTGKILLLVSILSFLCNYVQSARILGVFPFDSPSHYILGKYLMRGLAEAGHDVTMISVFGEKDPPKKGSYRDIILDTLKEDGLSRGVNISEFDKKNPFDFIIEVQEILFNYTEATLNHPKVKKLFNSGETFDAVIVEEFMNDAMKIFAYKLDAPLIVFSSVGATSWVNRIVANPSPLSYIPQLMLNYPTNMTFSQRLVNVFFNTLDQVLTYTYSFPRSNEILKRSFINPPDIQDLYYNVSLILLNSHESLSQAVPLVPTMVQIGGFHVQPPKKLPKDLQQYLDSAEDGVIYFSLGSNLKSRDLPSAKRDAILKAFSKLKQKVLWKWEEEELPGKPSNVKVSKWLPQQDILAHPNMKLFITHGGLLSSIETVYHGVPILAIPVFGDQPTNAKTAERNGYALSLPYVDFSEEKFSSLLDEMLNNPEYSKNVKRMSKIFHDRPLKPMQNAVFWVEYVINHNGAPHLRVAGVDLPWYKYLLLDVILVLTICIVLVLSLIYLGIKKLVGKCLGRKKDFKKKTQ